MIPKKIYCSVKNEANSHDNPYKLNIHIQNKNNDGEEEKIINSCPSVFSNKIKF